MRIQSVMPGEVVTFSLFIIQLLHKLVIASGPLFFVQTLLIDNWPHLVDDLTNVFYLMGEDWIVQKTFWIVNLLRHNNLLDQEARRFRSTSSFWEPPNPMWTAKSDVYPNLVLNICLSSFSSQLISCFVFQSNIWEFFFNECIFWSVVLDSLVGPKVSLKFFCKGN